MIEGTVLKFGYGDIAVGSNALTQTITFQQFKPSEKCGRNVPKDAEYIGDEIRLDIFSYDEYEKLEVLLKAVQKKALFKFMFKGYEFNFENYNPESVNVCLRNLNFAMGFYLLSMAC